jgi:purine-binding chemotaxis protein CheW
MSAENQFTTFYLGGLLFGVEVSRVQEVIRYLEMTPVPLASPVVRGLINLRGQIVTALDLRRRINLNKPASDDLPMNVVIRSGGEAVSLLVDEIGDVLEVREDDFERLPDSLQGEARELIRGTYKLKDKLLLVLDAEKAMELVE